MKEGGNRTEDEGQARPQRCESPPGRTCVRILAPVCPAGELPRHIRGLASSLVGKGEKDLREHPPPCFAPWLPLASFPALRSLESTIRCSSSLGPYEQHLLQPVGVRAPWEVPVPGHGPAPQHAAQVECGTAAFAWLPPLPTFLFLTLIRSPWMDRMANGSWKATSLSKLSDRSVAVPNPLPWLIPTYSCPILGKTIKKSFCFRDRRVDPRTCISSAD